MRPKTWTYTPGAANSTGFLSNATLATFTLTTTTPGDGLAHKVVFDPDGTPDLSAITVDLTGTDADGRTQTETITLTNGGGTTTSTKWYKTLVTAVPSATIGGETVDIGWSADAVGPTIPVNWRGNPLELTLMCDISGTINYDVEYTVQDVFASQPSTLTWTNHGTIVAKTADTDSSTVVPIRAVRVAVNSVTAGATLSLTVIQGG